ncbi:MAG: DUF1499 domain-containing protein [Caldilinea sp.]
MFAFSKTLLMSAGLLSAMALTACAAATPAVVEQSAVTRTLPPCPDSPNCVSTQALREDAQHYIEPITYTGSAADARRRLLDVIAAMPRTKIVTDEETYIHATFTSLIFRFVDDVQFVIDDATKTIHFRSASRIGRGDLGVNRKRMEEIRTRFNQAAAA